MCWISYLKSNQKLKPEYLEKAAAINKDGSGVMYYKDGKVEVYKTMDFEEFKAFLPSIEQYDRVIHLRYTSMGTTNLENSHPFPIGNEAYLMHNGTMSSLKTIACDLNSCSDNSDTKNLAEVIKKCTWSKFSNISPLVHQITGKTGNKLVIMEADGEVTIVNKNLGVEEDGIWYSNEYHVTRTYPSTTNTNSPYFNYYNRTADTGETTKVFVYGTLKKGYSNHGFLAGAKYIGKAETCSTYLMIGTDMPFPYLLKYARAADGGLKIQGEVYEVNSATLAKLDTLEGVPHHYKKEEIYIVTEDNKYMPVKTYMKATVSASDLAKPYISNFEKKSYTPTARSGSSYDNLQILTTSQLADMGSIELAFYLETLEKAYYGKTFNTHRNYGATAEELIDEIDMLHDFILEDFQELMEKHTTPFTPSYSLATEYMDD